MDIETIVISKENQIKKIDGKLSFIFLIIDNSIYKANMVIIIYSNGRWFLFDIINTNLPPPLPHTPIHLYIYTYISF